MDIENTTSASADTSAAQAEVSTPASSSESQSYRIPGTNRYNTISKKDVGSSESSSTSSETAAQSADPTTSPDNPLKAAPKYPTDGLKPGTTEFNQAAARRRIENSSAKFRAKIAELEEQNKILQEQLQALKPEELNKADAINRQIDGLQTQAETYATIVEQQELTEFEDRVAEAYPEAKEQFMEATYRYAKHVNNNEPELKKYITRPFGMIVLNEWYKRMDVPNYRSEWLNMTSYEKGQALAGFYQQIEGVARRLASGQDMTSRNNVPAAKGGRNSNAVVPNDDFGLALQNAQQQFSRRSIPA